MLGHNGIVLLRVSDNKWHWLFFKQRWVTIGPTHVPTITEEDALLYEISHTGIKLYLSQCFFLVQDSWKMRIFLKVLRARCPCKRFGARPHKKSCITHISRRSCFLNQLWYFDKSISKPFNTVFTHSNWPMLPQIIRKVFPQLAWNIGLHNKYMRITLWDPTIVQLYVTSPSPPHTHSKHHPNPPRTEAHVSCTC